MYMIVYTTNGREYKTNDIPLNDPRLDGVNLQETYDEMKAIVSVFSNSKSDSHLQLMTADGRNVIIPGSKVECVEFVGWNVE